MALKDRILELLYPTRCAFCHRLTPHGEAVCKACAETLPYARGAEQRRRLELVTTAAAPLYYEGAVRESLLRYKFSNLRQYAQIYTAAMEACARENGLDACEIITWVPLSEKRRRKRGYDQARLLAEELALRLDRPCVALLRKLRDNAAQSGIRSAEKRRANVLGCYAAVNREQLQGKRILLVDDILTTGATLTECAKTLLLAGAAEVSVIAVAQRRKEKKH